MIRASLVIAMSLLAAMCNSGSPAPAPVPTPTTTPTVVVTSPPPAPSVDAGASSVQAACLSARYAMILLGCPPEEDAFGGWVLECSGWPNATVITSCITKQSSCVGTRSCLGDDQ